MSNNLTSPDQATAGTPAGTQESKGLPEIKPATLAMVNRIKPCACGDRHVVTLIARDADTKEPLLIHHSLDKLPDLYFVSPHTDRWPEGPWHAHVARWASDMMLRLPDLKDQYFRHFKGGRYRVIRTAYDTATLQVVVIYKSLDHIGEEPWVRRYDSGDSPWLGDVERDGVKHRRFAPLETTK